MNPKGRPCIFQGRSSIGIAEVSTHLVKLVFECDPLGKRVQHDFVPRTGEVAYGGCTNLIPVVHVTGSVSSIPAATETAKAARSATMRPHTLRRVCPVRSIKVLSKTSAVAAAVVEMTNANPMQISRLQSHLETLFRRNLTINVVFSINMGIAAFNNIFALLSSNIHSFACSFVGARSGKIIVSGVE